MNRPNPALTFVFVGWLLLAVFAASICAQAPEPVPLSVGNEQEKTLAAKEVHNYSIRVQAGEFLRVLVQQKGIDVAVALQGTNKSKLVEVDIDQVETESLSFISSAGGVHTISVRASDDKAPAGRYAIKLEALRPPTDADRQRVAAEKLCNEAYEGAAPTNKPEEQKAALTKYAEALRVWRQLNDTYEMARTLRNIGELQTTLGDRRQAAAAYAEARSTYGQLPDSELQQAHLYANLATIQTQLNERAQAAASHQQALQLYRQIKDQEGEASTLNALGLLAGAQGEPRRSLELFQRSLPLWRDLKDQRNEANTLNNIGEAYRRLGEKRTALKFFQQALSLRRAVRDTAGQAITLTSLGATFLDLGELQKAIDAYGLALPLRRDPGSRAITLQNLGRAYDLLGAPQEALRNYEQTLQIARTAKAKRTEAETLTFMGLARVATGETTQAINTFNEALAVAREAKYPTVEAAVLNNLGLVYNSIKTPEKALESLNQSLPLVRQLGNRQDEAYVLNNLGFAYEALGNRAEALKSHTAALELARQVRDRQREAKIRFGLARLERDRGQLKRARGQIEETIKIVESLRAKLTDPNRRAEYRATTQQYYDLYIDVLMRLHKRVPQERLHAAALHVSERARARSLLELLTEAGAELRAEAAPELRERERELQERLNDRTTEQFNLLASQAPAPRLAAITEELDQLATQLREVQNQMRTSSPRYAELTQPRPLTAAAIQRRVLAPNTLLLEYALGEENSYLWALTATSLHSYSLPNRSEIEAAARRFYTALSAQPRLGGATPQTQTSAEATAPKGLAARILVRRGEKLTAAEAELRAAGAALSKLILAPVAAQLGTKRLLIVADGALQYVPFAALPAPVSRRQAVAADGKLATRQRAFISTQPLLVTHEIISLPSASTLAVLRREAHNRKPATKLLTIMADPVFEPQDERVKTIALRAAPANQPAPASGETLEAARILLKKVAKEMGLTAETEFGVPRLPYTRAEAEAISALVPADERQVSFDFSANRAAATNSELGQSRIVHLATHGFLNSLNPELSGLVLSLVSEQGAQQNGFLLAPELYNLKLDATDLVVLSACQTGLGKEVRGEGLVGLTRGFMYAGAPRVVVSLWAVSDRATADLMKTFYQGMLTQRLRPAAALRAAQLALWRQQQWQAPYYWAAFTLQGEWR